MKAYRCDDGSIQMFRPEENMKRLSKSAERLSLPVFLSILIFYMLVKFEINFFILDFIIFSSIIFDIIAIITAQ